MDEKKLAKLKALKERFMVGEGKTEHLNTRMGGKTPKGFTEHIPSDKMVGNIEEYKQRKALQQMASEARDDAKRQAKKIARSKALKNMGSGSSRLASKVGKLGGKIPVLGALAGPAITMALGGTPNDALASALDSENLGEGSDQVGDMGLSNADRLMAERRAMSGGKYEDGGIREVFSKLDQFGNEIGLPEIYRSLDQIDPELLTDLVDKIKKRHEEVDILGGGLSKTADQVPRKTKGDMRREAGTLKDRDMAHLDKIMDEDARPFEAPYEEHPYVQREDDLEGKRKALEQLRKGDGEHYYWGNKGNK